MSCIHDREFRVGRRVRVEGWLTGVGILDERLLSGTPRWYVYFPDVHAACEEDECERDDHIFFFRESRLTLI